MLSHFFPLVNFLLLFFILISSNLTYFLLTRLCFDMIGTDYYSSFLTSLFNLPSFFHALLYLIFLVSWNVFIFLPRLLFFFSFDLHTYFSLSIWVSERPLLFFSMPLFSESLLGCCVHFIQLSTVLLSVFRFPLATSVPQPLLCFRI